ncbi:MAG: hypothetical protein M3Q51_03510 [Pseudomonadota bacterium]|nr:hypothetical protein [Pseudomonadota bacterium]MDQ3160074.1 hypothetical protein [Pseudomonadota bacterium]
MTSIPPQTDAGTSSGSEASQQIALRSREALDAYLAANSGRATPFDAMPPLARRRFLDSLVFGSNGLGGFATDDLAMELTDGEIGKILKLFNASEHASFVHSRHPEAPPEWRQSHTIAEPVEAGFDELYRHRSSESGGSSALRERFDALFAGMFMHPGAIRSLPKQELLYLMRSVDLVASDTPTPVDIDRLRVVVAAMSEHEIALPQDYRSVYDAMLRMHRFADAKRYAIEHHDARLPVLPEMIDEFTDTAPSFTVWRTNGNTQLVRAALDLRPTQILVTAGCHFSEDAAEDITRDPVLGPAFAAHASWLLLPPGQEDQNAVREWNRRFPSAQAMQIYDRGDWTMLPPGWSMPTFFIVRDGKVLERIKGWPRQSAANRQLLIDAIERANLL